MNRLAFTLAETLITLGIIGIVAAMTLPSLIQSHANAVVETRLKKFYTSINQALMLSEVQYGDKQYWYQDKNTIITDKDGNVVKGASDVEKWWHTYIAPHMRTVQIKHNSSKLPIFYFADGSALLATQSNRMRDWIYYTTDPDKCIKKYKNSSPYGKCAFRFLYVPKVENTDENMSAFKYHINKGFEPYKYRWDGSQDGLINGRYSGCNAAKDFYCAALIQYNGWKIPKDYPFRVSY